MSGFFVMITEKNSVSYFILHVTSFAAREVGVA